MIPRPSVSNLNDGKEKKKTVPSKWDEYKNFRAVRSNPPPPARIFLLFLVFRFAYYYLWDCKVVYLPSLFSSVRKEKKKKILFFFQLLYPLLSSLGFSPRRAEFDGTCVSCRHSVMSLPPPSLSSHHEITCCSDKAKLIHHQQRVHPHPKPNGI